MGQSAQGQSARGQSAQVQSAPDEEDGAAARSFDAVILAGGRAKRLGGADKPSLTVGGRTLAGAVLSAAAGAADVIVVGPERHCLRGIRPGGSLRFVLEDPPGAGPVAALRRGLAEVSAPWVVLLAADLPFLRPKHMLALLTAAAGGLTADGTATGSAADGGTAADGAVAHRVASGGAASGRMLAGAATVAGAEVAVSGAVGQPPGAILVDDAGRPQWLIGCWRTGTLAAALRTYHGQSLRGLFAPMRPAEVTVTMAHGEPPPWLDCDSPADLRLARELAGRADRPFADS